MRKLRHFAAAACVNATILLWMGLGSTWGAILDAQGNVYIASSPITLTAPTTANAFQSTAQPTVCGYTEFGGGQIPEPCSHGYIQKISPDGAQLLAATYLGGSSQDSISSITIDAAGNIYVTGYTSSTDFPVTPDAFQSMPGAAFLSVLSPDCSKLIYSTYFSFGNPVVILLDQSGRVILTGLTQQSIFPATAPVTSNNVQRDAFVVRFNLAKSKLEFAVEIGGTMDDVVQTATLDTQGNIYISGYTSSTLASEQYTSARPYVTFPITPGAYSHMAGEASVFVVKLDSSGNIVYSTAYGGSGSDTSYTINADAEGAVYLTGASGSTDFPITPGAFQSAFSVGFATKLSADATKLVYSTFLGANPPAATAVDSSGTLHAAGTDLLSEFNFPSTPDAAQPCAPDSQQYEFDYYLELNGSGSNFQYATLVLASYLNSSSPVQALTAAGKLYLSAQNGLLSVIDAAARPAPGVTCLANAASYRMGGIAPGEIVTLFGPGIGPAQPAGFQLTNGQIGASLSGVKITFNGYPAPLLYVSTNQINAIVPFEVAGQPTAQIQVTNGITVLPQLSLPVVESAPAIFTLNGSGAGQAAVVNEDGSINSDAHPAPRGSIVSMYITGAGMLQPTPPDGSLGTGKTTVVPDITVSMLAFPATISYLGDAPGEVEGLVQINFQVPPTLYQTGYVPVQLTFPVSDPASPAQQALVWINVK